MIKVIKKKVHQAFLLLKDNECNTHNALLFRNALHLSFERE